MRSIRKRASSSSRMMARSLNRMRAVGFEKRTNTSPVVIATPTMPSRISIEATVWPIRLAGDMLP